MECEPGTTNRVVLTDWQPGLRKVSLTAVLREQAGLTLPDAKRAVDALLAGERVEIVLPTPEQAASLIQAAAALGAVGALQSGNPTRPDA